MKKICTRCGIEKRVSEFHSARKSSGVRTSRGGQGVVSVCKPCRAESRRPGICAERVFKRELAQSGMKTCSVCDEIKPFGEFTKRKASPDGLAYKCKSCSAEYKRAWGKNNPEAFKIWYQENRERRADYWKAWYSNNSESRREKYSEWARTNKGLINALIAKRSAAKKQATPGWADLAAIREIYMQAAFLSAETGEKYEVDHVYPLQGKLVCGLHCEHNLQILTKEQNVRKRNKMPEEFGYV